MKEQNQLFIRSITLNKEQIENKNIYPFNIEILKNFKKINLTAPVTFLIGENGTGNFNFSTKDTHSELYKYLTLNKTGIPETKFFLRAETFYNVSTEIVKLKEEGYEPIYKFYGGNLHECSHGEAFIKLVQNRFSKNGLYILDEPESALSPSRQMTLLALINDLVEKGSQFIIATHSPILIAYKNGKILDLNQNFKEVEYQESEIYQTYKMFIERHEEMQKYLFEK